MDGKPNSNSIFLPPKEASRLLGVPGTTLRLWAETGDINFIRKGGPGTKRYYNIQEYDDNRHLLPSHLEQNVLYMPESQPEANLMTLKDKNDICSIDIQNILLSLQNEACTSRTCSNCGWYHRTLDSNKIYTCGRCEMVMDRDVNAARNIYMRAWLEGGSEFRFPMRANATAQAVYLLHFPGE